RDRGQRQARQLHGQPRRRDGGGGRGAHRPCPRAGPGGGRGGADPRGRGAGRVRGAGPARGGPVLSKTTRILVIMGGWSAERAVSLETGQAVAECLERGGYPVQTFDLGGEPPRLPVFTRLLEALTTFRADVAYLALHGPDGEDGTMQGALELAGIPYNGSGVLASALGNDKPAANQVFVSSKITTPKYAVVPAAETPVAPPLPCPVIVKPRALGSSLGVVLVERPEDFPAALAHARSFGQEAMVEQYITGRELQACVIDGEALPLIEVVSANRLYD